MPGSRGAFRSVADHQRVVSDLIRSRPAETLAVDDALGLMLAADVVAPMALPMFDNSAMDGYAVRAEDVAAADLIVYLVDHSSFDRELVSGAAVPVLDCRRVLQGPLVEPL